MAACPKHAWPAVKAMLHSVYDQPGAKAVRAQFDRVVEAVAEKSPQVHDHLEEARADILAFTAVPKEIWRQIWSNNPQRATQPRDPPPHRRRRDLSRRNVAIRLLLPGVGTVLAEQHDDWIEGRSLPRTRRLGPPRMTLIKTAEDTKEAITSDTTGAISA